MSIRVQRTQSESRYNDAEINTEGSFRKDSDTQTAPLPKLKNESNQNNFLNIISEYLREMMNWPDFTQVLFHLLSFGTTFKSQ